MHLVSLMGGFMKQLLSKIILLIFLLSLINSTNLYASDIFSKIGVVPKYNKTYPPQMQNKDEDDKNIYLLSVELGRLTHKQFDTVKTYFKNQSQISYSETKIYKLEDFLPPVMQALLNKGIAEMDFSSLNYPKNEDGDEDVFFADKLGLKSGFSTLVNCIGTAIETARVIQTQNGRGVYYLYAPGRIDASQILKDIMKPVPHKNLQYSDVLYVMEKADVEDYYPDQVQHMAIYITKNIFFEKRDSFDNDPYRLVFIEDIQTRLNKVLGKENLRYRFGRFSSEDIASQSPKDERTNFLTNIKDFFDNTADLDKAMSVFDGLSEQIKNAIWVISDDEIGLGGGPERGMSFIEKIEIVQHSEQVSIQGDPATLKRILDFSKK